MGYTPEFTKDWFRPHIPRWEKILSGLKGKPARALEVGTYEGRAAVWLMENILTHDDASLVVIDPHNFDDEDAILGLLTDGPIGIEDWKTGIKKVHERFLRNTEEWRPNKLHYIRAGVQQGLREVPLEEQFDFVYIDGSHLASMVLTDIITVWPYLKKGGIMVLDDYLIKALFGENSHLGSPRCGIDAFTEVFSKRYTLMGVPPEHGWWQPALRKII